MGSVILISTVAIIVAIVGCIFIWRFDASRAEEIEHTAPPAPPAPRPTAIPGATAATAAPEIQAPARPIDS